jgi:hypothetical protein
MHLMQGMTLISDEVKPTLDDDQVACCLHSSV